MKSYLNLAGMLLVLTLPMAACNDQAPSFAEKLSQTADDVQGVQSEGDATAQASSFEAIEKEFSSSSEQTGELTASQDGDDVELYLTMGRQEASQSVEYTQQNREQLQDTFLLGTNESEGTDLFTQSGSPSGPLDILVVVDNSGSMAEEQVNLSNKLSKLLTYIQDSDWRIAVETTDPADGCGQFIINKNDANTEAAFADAVTRGINGSGNERGILQAVNGLKCNGGSWLRSQSTLAVLIVSDEDNCSDGTKCNGQAWSSSDYLTDYMDSIRTLGTNARVYGLIWHPTDFTCSDAARMGQVYASAVSASNGTWGSVCENDYSSTLQQISANIGTVLASQFSLKYKAKTGTAAVFVDGILQTSGYVVKEDVLAFDTPPADGAQIRIDYQYDASAPTRSFDLSQHGEIGEIQVYLDENRLDASAFSYNGQQGVVELNEMPSGRELKVFYRLGSLTQTQFSLGADLSGGTPSVYVNGQQVPEGQWAWAGDTVVFMDPPADGAQIKIVYTVWGAAQLAYPLFAPESAQSTLEVRDAATGEAVPYIIKDGLIAFNQADYIEGRSLVLHYISREVVAMRLDTGVQILSDRPILARDASGNSCPDGQIQVIGSVIDFGGCGFDPAGQVSFQFSYRTAQVLSFQVLEEIPETGYGDLAWKVYINGDETTAYRTVEGDGLRVEFDSLPDGSKILVRVEPEQI